MAGYSRNVKPGKLRPRPSGLNEKQEKPHILLDRGRMTRLSVNIAPALLGVTPLPRPRINEALYVFIPDHRQWCRVYYIS